MRITKDFLVKHGVCEDGLSGIYTVQNFFDGIDGIIDGGYSHKEVHSLIRKYFISNINEIDRKTWLEYAKWSRLLAESPQAIIDGGDAVIGEKYRAVSFNFEKVCDTIEEARAALDQKYADIKSDPMKVCKCFYWRQVLNGKQTQDIRSVDELIDGVEYNVFNSFSGAYEASTSLSEVVDMLKREQQAILSVMKGNSVIEVSVRDAVDGYLCWIGEEQHAFA